MVLILDDPRRHSRGQLLPAHEVQLTEGDLPALIEVVRDHGLEHVVVVPAHDPHRDGLGYALDRERPNRKDGRRPPAPAEELQLGPEHVLVLLLNPRLYLPFQGLLSRRAAFEAPDSNNPVVQGHRGPPEGHILKFADRDLGQVLLSLVPAHALRVDTADILGRECQRDQQGNEGCYAYLLHDGLSPLPSSPRCPRSSGARRPRPGCCHRSTTRTCLWSP